MFVIWLVVIDSLYGMVWYCLRFVALGLRLLLFWGFDLMRFGCLVLGVWFLSLGGFAWDVVVSGLVRWLLVWVG